LLTFSDPRCDILGLAKVLTMSQPDISNDVCDIGFGQLLPPQETFDAKILCQVGGAKRGLTRQLKTVD